MPELNAAPTATPIAVSLSPRDCFAIHTALEAAVLEITTVDLGDNELLTRLTDLEFRFRRLLKDGVRTNF